MKTPVFVADQSLADIVDLVRAWAQTACPHDSLVLRVLDPDAGGDAWAGALVALGEGAAIHRPWRVWCDLAERLRLRLRTPRPAPGPYCDVCFEMLDPRRSWHDAAASQVAEKYGVDSGFAQIQKLEDPWFLLDLVEALERVALAPGARILDVGVNTGDELLALERAYGERASSFHVVGIDHCASALAVARTRFDPSRYAFVTADVGELASLDLGVFDLVLAIGALQSPGIDDRALLRSLFAHHLAPAGAVILGVPNCRYVDGEVLYGAKCKNYATPEASLWIKDVAFYRKYLQQHRRRVFTTGKTYIWVTGVAIGAMERPGISG